MLKVILGVVFYKVTTINLISYDLIRGIYCVP